MNHRKRIQIAGLVFAVAALLWQQRNITSISDDLARLESELAPLRITEHSNTVSKLSASLSDKPGSDLGALLIEEFASLDKRLAPHAVEERAMKLAHSGRFDQASALADAYLSFLADYPEKLYAIARIDIERDSKTKLAWLLKATLPKDKLANHAGFIKAWTKVDFNAVAHHLSETPAGEDRDQATSTFVQTIAGHEPEAAIGSRIPNPGRKRWLRSNTDQWMAIMGCQVLISP
ncbi:MAG: hypothetical protein ACKVHP_02070 [Verrucomicrobiales bacterium]